MNSGIEFVVRGVLIGSGATACIAVWAQVLKRGRDARAWWIGRDAAQAAVRGELRSGGTCFGQ